MKCYSQTIGNIRDKFKYKQLELNPPYQRRPVWKTKQRMLLISSIFNGIPIPAIILHKHFDKKRNKDIYDVLDGKQRVETILHFIELIDIDNEGDWTIKIKKNPDEFLNVSFTDLKSKKFNKENNNIAGTFWNYEIPVIEYEGELTDFFENPVPTMEVFVRINSTGSTLKRNEIRHANSSAPFFKLGDELERKYLRRFKDVWGIFSENEVQRYLFHEFILELCTSLYFHNYTDRRKKLEELLYNHSWKSNELNLLKRRFGRIIQWMRSIFNDEIFVNTRFTNKSDFYSIFVVLNELIDKKYVTSSIKDNKILGNTLLDLSKAAQLASSQLKKYDINNSTKGYERELLQYVIATRQSTDSLTNRQIRHEYLQKLLKGFILKRKDDKRIFDQNIKGVLWTRLLQRSTNPKCPNPDSNPKCVKALVYDDAQVDHIYPWSKGGKTNLKNAQLICSSCNKRKGSK
jgi:5-methylcytosine-specific restriction endonuclease McrA